MLRKCSPKRGIRIWNANDSIWFMKNKLLYWIPVVGIFVTLLKYDEDNEMGTVWMFYQALALMGFIAGITIVME